MRTESSVISKSINTLVADINATLREDKKFSQGGLDGLVDSLSKTFVERLGEKNEVLTHGSKKPAAEGSGVLRMSNFGTKCDRKLWYTVNRPDAKEALLAHTRLKFLYGDIVESLVLSLAKEAGHSVEGEQDELVLDGVVGHRDAVIDGLLVDVKSANSRSFSKFKAVEFDDTFGYMDQLNLYLEASQRDPLVKIKKAGGLLAVDKELGHLHLRLVPKDNTDWPSKIADRKAMVGRRDLPDRPYKDVPDGLSGNRKLGTMCAYCQFKNTCWPELRTFVYSSGPVFMTKVVREPNVLEVT